MLGTLRMLLSGSSSRAVARRGIYTSAKMTEPAPLPPKKPMGAFRSGLFGFLLGTVLTGTSIYSYLVGEYKASNELLTEDIYTLQASVTRLSNYVQNLEQRLQEKRKQ